ncbi:E3 SUMO-protein ligase pli1 [Parahypoxylon ruwenzoriense]
MASNADIRSLERVLSTLLNKQLQQICSAHGLKTSGVKADLQNRIKNALVEKHWTDPGSFGAIRNTIMNIRGGNTANSSHPTNYSHANMATPSGSVGHSQSQGSRDKSSKPYPTAVSSVSYQGENGQDYNRQQQQQQQLFKQTPFYKTLFQIGHVHRCDAMNNHRNSVNITFKSSEFRNSSSTWPPEPSRRLMLFCGTTLYGPQDVQFPHQSELKVNGEDVKANLRGLKNKPGTTLPVDITPYVRLKLLGYENSIDFTYALTTKTFYLALFAVEMSPIDDLVAKIKGQKIAKASVIRDMTDKANDPDVVATSQVLSLKCPISYTRLRTPCRSVSCNHIQCFDANSYLQLQEQGPTWSCPICFKPAPFDSLAVDEYVYDILRHTPDSMVQVTIEPDGQWRTKTEHSGSDQSRSGIGSRIEDDDDLSIVSPGLSSGTASTPVNAKLARSTPSRSLLSSATPSGGRRGTPNTSASRSGSNKRPAEVIDLTLSSDEDEPVLRTPKRQNQGTSSGIGFGNY